MRIHRIETDGAPKAIGPYSQAIQAGDLLFCSGQIALDPVSGQLVQGPVADETELVLRNLRAILEAAGSGMDRVVKTTVYLTRMADFAEMNQAYERAFPGRPARATVAVAELPKGARVEIEAIALAGRSS